MNKLILSAAASLLAAQVAFAGAATAASQQDKMSACSKQAGEKQLKGAERKAFMKQCLSSKKAEDTAAKADDKAGVAAKTDAKAAAKSSQQEKMKACNKEAGEKKLGGEERNTFMRGCLKG